MEADHTAEWAKLTPEEKKRKLYEKQKALPDTLLEHRAITQEQYDKSLGDLTEKMRGSEQNTVAFLPFHSYK